MPREFGSMPPEVMKEAVKKPEAKEVPVPPELKEKARIAADLLDKESALLREAYPKMGEEEIEARASVLARAAEEEAGVAVKEEVPVKEGIPKRERRLPTLKSRLEGALRALTLVAVSSGLFAGEARAGEALPGVPKPAETLKEGEPKKEFRIEYGRGASYVKIDATSGKIIEERKVYGFQESGSPFAIADNTIFYDEGGRETKNIFLERDTKGNINKSREAIRDYDSEGRKIKSSIVYRNGEGNIEESIEWVLEYNTEGREIKSFGTVRDGEGHLVETTERNYEYDTEGRETKAWGMTRDGEGNIDETYEWVHEYDTKGMKTATFTFRDGEGNIKRINELINERDTEGRVIKSSQVYKNRKGDIVKIIESNYKYDTKGMFTVKIVVKDAEGNIILK